MSADPVREPELWVGDLSLEAMESDQAFVLDRLDRMVLLAKYPASRLSAANGSPLFTTKSVNPV